LLWNFILEVVTVDCERKKDLSRLNTAALVVHWVPNRSLDIIIFTYIWIILKINCCTSQVVLRSSSKSLILIETINDHGWKLLFLICFISDFNTFKKDWIHTVIDNFSFNNLVSIGNCKEGIRFTTLISGWQISGLPTEYANVEDIWVLLWSLCPHWVIFPIDWSICRDVMKRDLDSDDTGIIVLFNLANCKIWLKIDPFLFGVRVSELHDVSLPEANTLVLSNLHLLPDVDH